MTPDAAVRPDAFLRRLVAVPEPAMQEAIWGEALGACSPVESAALVLIVLDAMVRRQESGRVGYLALVRVLERSSRARLALQLAARHHDAVAWLVSDGYPMRTAEIDDLPGPPLKTDRDVTLGERRSWARRPDRDLLDRLLHDPDPIVIRHLLQNPRVVEVDVLRIASKRPVAQTVLSEVFHHSRWGRRTEVQLALVLNPYTPVLIAAGLVALLDVQRVEQIRQNTGVHAAVRDRAEVALSWRRGLVSGTA